MSLEVADLVDKLGRAVLQRDENLREKSKAQALPWGRWVGGKAVWGKMARFGDGLYKDHMGYKHL